MSTKTLPRGRRLNAEEAHQTVYDAIIAGDIKPGERITEEELAKSLGISRTPVREALRRLETQGLLAHAPHRGMVVRELEQQEITELYEMREVLEGAAAASAAQHASEIEIESLEELIKSDEKRLDDPKALAASNKLFHETLYRSAHNRYLVKTLTSLRSSMAVLGPTTLSHPGRAKTALAEHKAIVACLKRGDAEGACEAAKQHTRNAYRTRIAMNLERSTL